MGATVKPYQASFVGGEISPDMFGRKDLESYGQGLALARNVYVSAKGGVYRREGWPYVDNTTSNQWARIIGFQFNTEQKYLLSFTPGEMKVYKDDVLVATVTSSPVSALTADQIAEMKWAQSADTLLLFHGDVQTIEISRTSHTTWTTAAVTYSNIPTYDFGSGAEAVISGTRGWPVSGSFSDGRLWLCGLKSRPQTSLASKVNSYFDLNEGTGLDDEAINHTIDDSQVNAIIDCLDGPDGLEVYTTGGPFIIRGSLGDPITPEKIATQFRRAERVGISTTSPAVIDGASVFIENGGQTVRQLVYDDIQQRYKALNISIRSSHLINNPSRLGVRGSTAAFPFNFLFVVNNDGTVAVLNLMREEKLLAWSLFETEGVVEDLAVVGQDVYVVVRRTIDGNTRRFIEKFDSTYHLDGSKQSTASPASDSWTGFSHLEGQECQVRGDDFVLENVTPVGGAFTSSSEVETIEVGFYTPPRVELLPLAIISNGEISAGQKTRVAWVNIRLYQSRNILVQYEGNSYRPKFRKFGAVLGTPVPLFSGWKKVGCRGLSREPQILITNEGPLEFNLLGVAVAARVDVET